MSVDLAHPPPNSTPQDALQITQLAPKYVNRASTSLPWPLSLFSRDDPPEVWAAYETLYMECLRTGDDKSARTILDRLLKRFGDKNERVMAYQGMWEEATAQNDKELAAVLGIYEDILAQNPANMPVQKRRICLLKNMGKNDEAIKKLVALVSVSPIDAEAWSELSALYESQGLLDQAIFCLEEVLLIQPNAWNVHARIAELIYITAQSASNNAVELARIYAEAMRRYLRSIELCDNYLRGYYGLFLTSQKLVQSLPAASKTTSKDETYNDLALPTEGTAQALHEMATSKLGEIVRRSSAQEVGWDGYAADELAAARRLLDQSTDSAPR